MISCAGSTEPVESPRTGPKEVPEYLRTAEAAMRGGSPCASTCRDPRDSALPLARLMTLLVGAQFSRKGRAHRPAAPVGREAAFRAGELPASYLYAVEALR